MLNRATFFSVLILTGSLSSASAAAEEKFFSIDQQQSLLLIHVDRGGLAGMFGHEHAVASESLQGEIIVPDEFSESRANLVVPLTDLIVDKPAHREALGLKPDVSAESIRDTRNNMHEHVLQSDVNTSADVVASIRSINGDRATLNVHVTLRGVSHDYEVPVTLSVDDAVVQLSGKMTMKHRDFDMKPFRAAGGLLRVGKKLQVEFSVLAYRVFTDE